MQLMIKNISFKRRNNPRIFFPADESRNIYKLEKDDYDKLLTENVTKTYKKSSRTKVNRINYNTKRRSFT